MYYLLQKWKANTILWYCSIDKFELLPETIYGKILQWLSKILLEESIENKLNTNGESSFLDNLTTSSKNS